MAKSVIKNPDGKTLCPHCHSEVNANASRCPHCQGKIYQWTLTKKFIAGGIILIAISTVFSSLSGSDSSTSTEVAEAESVAIGSEGYLHEESESNETLVFPTEEGLDEFVKAAVRNDEYGLTEVAQTHGAFFVPNGTRILVLDTTIGTRKFRILEGEYTGQSAWTVKEFVRK